LVKVTLKLNIKNKIDMAMKTRILGKEKVKKSPGLLSQKEIIARINKSTRLSYKYLNLLINRK